MTDDELAELLTLSPFVEASGIIKYKNSAGQLHRVHGPAVIWPKGDRYWVIYDLLHRDDGPAVEFASGVNQWWINGRLHRENGPAITSPDGYEGRYHYGLRHRTDGPAVIRSDGQQQWCLDGYHVTQDEWRNKVRDL